MPPPTSKVPTHVLNPSMVFAHREEHVISTLLGSCIAVCLWDSRLKVGGMNHFMLPLWQGRGLPTPKYGDIAIEKLLQSLGSMGSRKGDLVAKVFGGANVVHYSPGLFSVGERNILVAEETLSTHGIPILAKEVGGNRAMKIDFNSKDGSVILRLVARPEWAPPALPDLRRR